MKTKATLSNLAIAATLLLLSACGGTPGAGKKAPGGVEYGHVFRVNEVSDVRSMFPLNITEATGFRIANQVYEGLVKFNQETLEVEPGLAESWEVNESATEWTFHLRKGVKFHDDPCFEAGKGREMKAQDVEWCVRMLCMAMPQNQMFWLAADRLQGARSCYEMSMNSPDEHMELPGVEVVDDYTVKFKLNYPFAGFLQLLGHTGFYIYPKEAYEKYGVDMNTHAVGTGPFLLKAFKPNELAVLERNANYWAKDEHGNQLPYLDAVQVSFVKDKKSELLKFKNGELDMVFTLPIEMYADVMSGLAKAQTGQGQDFQPQVKPSMSVYYYAFQHQHPVFGDVRVRKAFNMSVDRKALVNHTLQGEGTPGLYGVVPPAFTQYNHQKLNPTTYDPQKARELLAEAGYPDGTGFPEITLELTSGGSNNELVAQVVTKMIQDNLGVKINLQVMSINEQLNNAESGKAAFWRDGWIADYPDPENFLRLFVSDSIEQKSSNSAYLNSTRYYDNRYDSIYNVAVRETNVDKRYELYRQLDQILIDNAVVLPLYYEEFTRLIPGYVENFPQNSIEYRDFSTVWINSDNQESGTNSAAFMR